MGRSFDCVDYKLMEAEFFAEKIANAGADCFAINCYFSAYVTAARSVTFSLQATLKDIPEFEAWYTPWQDSLRKDPLARQFLDYRNRMQKTGELPIRYASVKIDSTGDYVAHHYLQDNQDPFNTGRTDDLATLVKTHLVLLIGMIADCYDKLGYVIDPDQYYTLKNIDRLGLSIEDVEESLDFPRGWTKVDPSISAQLRLPVLNEAESREKRLTLLKREIPRSQAKWLFEKYLGNHSYQQNA